MAASFRRLAVTVCLVAALCGSATAQKCGGRPPNVIVIMLDDLGFHDLGIQREIYGDLGSTDVRTPNIDKLIKRGALFKEAYSVAGFCSPARAGFITGIHPYHTGHRVNPVRDPKDRTASLPLEYTILPQTLKRRGYVSGMFGKWHLGVHAESVPRNRGFDFFMGFVGSGFPYFEFEKKFKGAYEYIYRQFKVFSGVTYLTDDFTQQTIEFVENNRNKPFFAFLAYNAVHSPYDYLESDVDPRVSEARVPHVAMIKAVDRGVGQIVAKLNELNLNKCTMIIFTNDNGGHENGANNAPLKQFKGKVWEGGVRVPISFTYPGVIKANQRIGGKKLATLLDLYPTIEEVAGIPKGQRNKAVEGLNLMPHMTLVGDSRPKDTGATQPVFNRNQTRATVRRGRWKLWLELKDSGKVKALALYDLKTDIREDFDVLKDHKTMAEEMRQLYLEWNKKTLPAAFTQKSRDNPIKITWEKTHKGSTKVNKTKTFKAIITYNGDSNVPMNDIQWEVFKSTQLIKARYRQIPRKPENYDIQGGGAKQASIKIKRTGDWIVRINVRKGDFLQWIDQEIKVVK